MVFSEPVRLSTEADHARIRLDSLADQLEDLVARLRHEIARIDEKGGIDERTDNQSGRSDFDKGG